MSDLQRSRAGRGRIIPFKQREVEGTTRKAAVGSGPATKRGLGSPPKAMPADVRRVWNELKRDVDWLAQSSDRVLVEGLAWLVAEWRAARAVVARDGPYDPTDGGLMVESIAAVRARRLWEQIAKALPKLGMTPADVHRVIPSDGPSVANPVDALLDD